MEEQYWLTTKDNPFNPYTQREEWMTFDQLHGYNSCGLTARFAHTSDELSDYENNQIISDAIDKIVSLFGDFFVKFPNPDNTN